MTEMGNDEGRMGTTARLGIENTGARGKQYPLRVAVVGAGQIARVHVPIIGAAAAADLVAIV